MLYYITHSSVCTVKNNRVFRPQKQKSAWYVGKNRKGNYTFILRGRYVNSKKLDERANNAIMNNHTAGVHFPMDFSNLLVNILKFFMYGSVVSMLHPLIVVLLALCSAVNGFVTA